jgi:hypothetical protein
VRPRLCESHLGGEKRKAVARRSRQEDASNVQRVEDLLRRIPQPGGGQKVDIESCAMTDRLTAAQKRR